MSLSGEGSRSMVLPGEGSWNVWCSLESWGEMSHLNYLVQWISHTIIIIHANTHMHARTHARTHVCTHTCALTHAHSHIHLSTYIPMHALTHVLNSNLKGIG